VKISEESLGAFDVDNIELEALLFQTGYLTISEKFKVGSQIHYLLKYPNLEVKASLTEVILKFLTGKQENSKRKIRIISNFTKIRIIKMKDVFHSFFASILTTGIVKTNWQIMKDTMHPFFIATSQLWD
jgi:hypothetical protein